MAKRQKRGTTRKFNLEAWVRKSKRSLTDAANRAKEDKGGFEEFDDGRYRMQLRKATIGPSSSSGRIQVTTEWKFLSGEYKGKTYRSYRGVDDADGQFYFLLDAKRLGYDMDDFDPEEIGDLLDEMTKDKPVMSCALKTKGDFQNLLINGPADEEDEDDEDEEEEERPRKKTKKAKKEEDEEDDEEDDEEEDDEDDEEERPRKRRRSKKDEEEEDDEEDDNEEEDDDDEEEETPRRRRGSKSKKKKVEEEDDEEEEDGDEEDGEEEDDEEPPARKKRSRRSKKDDEEDDEEEEDDNEVPVTVGSIVKAKIKGKTQKAEVIEVFPDDDELKVKTDAGKTVRIPTSDISSVVDLPKKGKRRRK